MQRFRAFRIHVDHPGTSAVIRSALEWLELEQLAAGEVVIRVAWSDINYKDALAATGAGRILRRYPLVGGVDLSGIVEHSNDSRFAPGDAVLVTGCGLSETHDGGYAEFARVKGDWVIPLPAGPRASKAASSAARNELASAAVVTGAPKRSGPPMAPVARTGVP